MNLKLDSKGVYIFDYYDTFGIRRRQRLGRNKRLAEQMVDNINDQIKRQKLGLLPRVVESKMTLRELVKKYMDINPRENRASSLERKRYAFDHILPKYGDRLLISLQDSDFYSYLDERKGEKVPVTTRNRELAALKSVFSFAVERKIITHSPVASIKMFSERDFARKRTLSKEEEVKFMKIAPPLLQQLTIFALQTGMRVTEILTLTWDRVDFQNRMIFIPASMCKSKRDRYVPITSKALEILRFHYPKISADKVVVLGVKKNQNIDQLRVFDGVRDGQWRHLHEKTCKIAEIEGLRRHDLRRTMASRYLEVGNTTIAEVAAWLGDTVAVTASVYTQPTMARMRESGERMAGNF